MLAGVDPHNFRNASHVASSTATRATRAPTGRFFRERSARWLTGGAIVVGDSIVAGTSESGGGRFACFWRRLARNPFALQSALATHV
jgi:hypothetical protein